MTEKDVIKKRVLGNNPYRPALLGEIRNYYRDKYSLVWKKSVLKIILFNVTMQVIKIVIDAYQSMII